MSQRNFIVAFLAFSFAYFVFAGADAFALPAFLLRFSQDPFSKPEFRNQCSTCHINPKGGGPRNPFGEAFARSNHMVTPELRRQWPDHFMPSVTTPAVPTNGGEMKATFLPNEQETILLEIDGQHYRLDPKRARLDKIEPQQAEQLAAAPPPPVAPPEGKLPLRNQPTFDHYLVNLPTTLPYDKGVLSMRFTHRFTQPVLGCDGQCASIGELYGLDSFSYSSFGGEFGVTRNLAATLYRSPLDRTIEMGGVFQLWHQAGKQPFAAAFRASIEGRNNFQQNYTTNLMLPVSGKISNIAELFVVPTFSFHANVFASQADPNGPEGDRRRNQTTIGLGTSIRFRPRTAFVAEWQPRVAGWHATGSVNAYSFGLLRSTNGHVFELVLTNTVGTTTSRAINTASDQFSLGFNIYRKLHQWQW